MEFLSIITAFGLGSILTSFVQWFVANRSTIKQRKYDERKEAYVGLLESWVRQEKENFSGTSELDVGHWLLRSQLVASENVYSLLESWGDTVPGADDRVEITKKLKSAMRDDLRSI